MPTSSFHIFFNFRILFCVWGRQKYLKVSNFSIILQKKYLLHPFPHVHSIFFQFLDYDLNWKTYMIKYNFSQKSQKHQNGIVIAVILTINWFVLLSGIRGLPCVLVASPSCGFIAIPGLRKFRYMKLVQTFQWLSDGRRMSGIFITLFSPRSDPSRYGLCIFVPSLVKSLMKKALVYNLHLFTWWISGHLDCFSILSSVAVSCW